jgi:hypothetical protein
MILQKKELDGLEKQFSYCFDGKNTKSIQEISIKKVTGTQPIIEGFDGLMARKCLK